MSIESLLKQVPFFGDLTDEQLARLARACGREALDAGQVVYREGDRAGKMYVILAGTVKLTRHDDQGTAIDLQTLAAGNSFGEQALLESGPRPTTVATLAPCEFLTLDQIAFHALLLQARGQIVFRVFAALSSQVRATTERLFKEELARQALRAEMEIERHRAMSQMVAGVAHEINTPLGTTNTALSIIKRELTSSTFAALLQDRTVKQAIDDMLEAAALMERNIQRAHKLTQDFKKISVSQLTDTKETMNLPEAVAEIVGLHQASAKRARLDIQIENTLPPETQTWVGYRGYLSHILLNFLTNIERYAYPRGVGGKVAITLAADGSRAVPVYVLSVRDFGQGIPPDNLPKLFEPFFTTGRIQGGTGLGLSIVRNMVTGPLQGTVEVASAVGQGTTFTVAFPQRIVDHTGG